LADEINELSRLNKISVTR